MDKLPNCKLCGSEPVEIQTYQCMKYMCSDKSCTLNHVLFRLDQWIALMGEDRDAARYRWLRKQHEKHLGLTICKVGMFDLTPWSGDDPDAAIDAAMAKEQGDGN